MRIGNKYSDNKIYRGIKHSNQLPLIAEDLHEFSDTILEKNNHLLESIIGSGILKEIEYTTTDTSINLTEPIIVNILGDICLIGTSIGVPLLDKSSLPSGEGTIFLVGWYQNITAADTLTSTSTIREYGGVNNITLTNDLAYEPLDGIQVSSRYQFRWDISSCLGNITDNTNLQFIKRRASGSSLHTTSTITTTSHTGSLYKATSPIDMNYTVDGLYILPLFKYTKIDSIVSLEAEPPRRFTSAGMNIIESITEPVGSNVNQGTVWYNPDTTEFKTYIEGRGFIASASRMGFLQYQYIDIAIADSLTPSDMSYNIDVPALQENDIITVLYEGLELTKTTDYTIDITNKTITLLSFTRLKGEKLVVTITRLVEASDVTSLTSIVTSHISLIGNTTVEGHVKLSDTMDSTLGISSGVAATPKAIYESIQNNKFIKDDITDINYVFGIEDGVLYLEEVE